MSESVHPKDKISPSSVYYCPMECEGEKVYFQPGKRCPVCNMYLVPIEERTDYQNKTQAFSKNNLPPTFAAHEGDYFCPMFCEGDKTYPEDKVYHLKKKSQQSRCWARKMQANIIAPCFAKVISCMTAM